MSNENLTQEQKDYWRNVARKSSPTAKMYPPKNPTREQALEMRILEVMKVYKVDRQRAIEIATNPL